MGCDDGFSLLKLLREGELRLKEKTKSPNPADQIGTMEKYIIILSEIKQPVLLLHLPFWRAYSSGLPLYSYE